jgi:hypothetical protein
MAMISAQMAQARMRQGEGGIAAPVSIATQGQIKICRAAQPRGPTAVTSGAVITIMEIHHG